jgi:asparagine synthase (glutamine-hydrolysing)
MCGIAGVFSPSSIGDREKRAVGEMVGRMVHRGPDSAGMFEDAAVVLGMRRLSIIDLEGGQQPLFNETGDIVIICNGEIYNHVALRRDLQSRGHEFHSQSDTETIVHLYEEYGLDCLKHLRGMFAFALWDKRTQKLILARDRMGEKPLYWLRDPAGSLWFASEIRSLLSAGWNQTAELSPRSANLFLTFQYIPEPETPIKGISLLPAGHVWVVSAEKPDNYSQAYWDFMDMPERDGEPIREVRTALDEACRLMGTADVPVGVALSGGIDSSLVAVLTAAHYPGQIHAFSVGYTGRPESDERSAAEWLARRSNIPFTEVELTAEEVVAEFPRLVNEMDTPVGDIAAYGYYAVSKAARKAGVPVLLSGMGGDEFFWGYDWVRQAVARNRNVNNRRASGWLRKLFNRTEGEAKYTFFEVHDELRLGDVWSRQLFTRKALDDVPEGYWLVRNSLKPAPRMDLAVSDLLIRTWLRSNCLALCDRVSMAHSVEMRLPLLDVELVELVTGLRRAGLEDWRKSHKWLMIQAVSDILPAEVLKRKKQGFTPPTHTWQKRISETYQPLLRNGALVETGLVEPDVLEKVLPTVSPFFCYKLVLLELWVRSVILGQTMESIHNRLKGDVAGNIGES